MPIKYRTNNSFVVITTYNHRYIYKYIIKKYTEKVRTTVIYSYNCIISQSLLVASGYYHDAHFCVWVSDITYLKVGDRHAYLCFIIDLFSRMVVGWKLSNSMKANLVCDTINASFVKRGRPTNLIFHSD